MKSDMFEAHKAMEDRHWWFSGRRNAIGELVEYVMCQNDRNMIIDVGCGTGGTVSNFATRWPIIGIDVSEEAISAARDLYPECDFRVGRVPEDISPLSDQISLWLLMDVLEHIENDRGFLENVIEAARPGSHILITVPANPKLWSVHDETAHHLRRYDWGNFVDLWSGMNVKVRIASYYNARLRIPIYLVRKISGMLGISFGKRGTDFSIPPEPFNKILTLLFSGEAKSLMRGIDSPMPPYRNGVSLIALLKKV